jgi:hypothetical protein
MLPIHCIMADKWNGIRIQISGIRMELKLV